MIIDKLREFFKKNCPLLDGRTIRVNYLSEKPFSCSLDTVSSEEIIKKYPDGGSMRQLVFVFASREIYDAQLSGLINTAELYELLSSWMEDTSEKGELPELGEKLSAVKLEALSGGYLHGKEKSSARYQIKCRLIYEKEAV